LEDALQGSKENSIAALENSHGSGGLHEESTQT
jgi:hypothetical protein